MRRALIRFAAWLRTEYEFPVRVPVHLSPRGMHNALAAYLCSLAHEVVHYQQWLQSGDTTERGVAVRARHMVDRYAMVVRHP